jgi:hypothetical protein
MEGSTRSGSEDSLGADTVCRKTLKNDTVVNNNAPALPQAARPGVSCAHCSRLKCRLLIHAARDGGTISGYRAFAGSHLSKTVRSPQQPSVRNDLGDTASIEEFDVVSRI